VTNQPHIVCTGILPRQLWDFQYGHSVYLPINELIMLTSLYKKF